VRPNPSFEARPNGVAQARENVWLIIGPAGLPHTVGPASPRTLGAKKTPAGTLAQERSPRRHYEQHPHCR